MHDLRRMTAAPADDDGGAGRALASPAEKV
jgi:hypothetical protein